MKEAASPPVPFLDQAACIEAWFDVLGPMNGASSKDHRSGIYPIEGRLNDLRQLFERTTATRASGVPLPLFSAFDSADLDLLDRLLLLALLRDSLDARSGGGVVLARLCDAAGASSHVQQESVRTRLEEKGNLRTHRFVESDADPLLEKRFYHLPDAAREGYRYTVDEDGDLSIRREGRWLVLFASDDDSQHFRLSIPAFWECESEAEANLALELVNEIDKEYKVVRFVLKDGWVWASVKMYLEPMSAFAATFDRCADLLCETTAEFRRRMRRGVAEERRLDPAAEPE